MSRVGFSYKMLIKLLILSFALSSGAYAKRFASQYCEFELPSGWDCNLEGAEWVCQHNNAKRKKESIIILAAKIKGPQDTLSNYQSYLKKVKTFNLPGGKQQVSDPKYDKTNRINGHMWVDALHLSSEVPGFYTRYLATVKEDLGVAVTFSAAKDFFHLYQPIFDKIIASLRVFRQKKKKLTELRIKRTQDTNFENTTFIPEAVNKHDISKKKVRRGSGKNKKGEMLLYLIIGVVAVGGFFLMGKKKKKGKKKRKG
jgi:hypothetical protein